ncbi:MarC family protein [Variovorax sp.]|uniref:MarC family protein n=1 Tax=Variovorax sp. TaxID=1871043 RepID=UPI002D4E155C|nr:MarC family protein [Variovorax sp.]HYP82870.1 MarC family protein [Variovorax sp.]
MTAELLTYLVALGKSAFLVVGTLLPIINPPSTATIFLSLTEGASHATRWELARRIAGNVFLLMLGCTLVGSYVLDFFGISLDIVRVGGGLLVIQTGWRLLSAERSDSPRASRLAEAYTPDMVRSTAFYPLSFPITCGPGTLAATITVGVSLSDPSWTMALARTTGSVIGLGVVAAVILFCYRYAEKLLRPLGETGTIIFLRLSAFILLCLGIQIFWEGAGPLISAAVAVGNGR